jgi:crotonobetainyl-CoA:carnitine CoA-transferase CaiB-like acyl-CoA transferase
MNMPWLADDPDFADHRARGDNQERLDQIISEWLGGLEEAEALTVLDAHAVPVGRLYRARDMLADPQFIARDSIISVEDADLGPIPMQAVTPRLSETPGSVRWPGPALGEHDGEVRQWLADWPNRS